MLAKYIQGEPDASRRIRAPDAIELDSVLRYARESVYAEAVDENVRVRPFCAPDTKGQ